MGAIEELLRRNERYAAGFTLGDLPVPPSLGIAVVTCMDARLETGTMLGLSEGEAHVIRNAGAVVTDDVLRSLVISQRLLGTREILLIQHTGCGMLSFREDELKETIERETGLRPRFAFESFPDLEAEVRQSLVRVRACPFLPHKEALRGFVYEVESGRLREVT